MCEAMSLLQGRNATPIWPRYKNDGMVENLYNYQNTAPTFLGDIGVFLGVHMSFQVGIGLSEEFWEFWSIWPSSLFWPPWPDFLLLDLHVFLPKSSVFAPKAKYCVLILGKIGKIEISRNILNFPKKIGFGPKKRFYTLFQYWAPRRKSENMGFSITGFTRVFGKIKRFRAQSQILPVDIGQNRQNRNFPEHL